MKIFKTTVIFWSHILCYVMLWLLTYLGLNSMHWTQTECVWNNITHTAYATLDILHERFKSEVILHVGNVNWPRRLRNFFVRTQNSQRSLKPLTIDRVHHALYDPVPGIFTYRTPYTQRRRGEQSNDFICYTSWKLYIDFVLFKKCMRYYLITTTQSGLWPSFPHQLCCVSYFYTWLGRPAV